MSPPQSTFLNFNFFLCPLNLDPLKAKNHPNFDTNTTKVMLLFSLPWGKTVPSLEQAVLSQVQCSFLTKQTFLFKSGFSQSSTSLIKETRAKELQLCWLGAIINSKCLCCLFLSGQHQLTSKLLSQKYKYRIKSTQSQ